MQRRPRVTRATTIGWLAGATSVVLAATALTAAPASSAPIDQDCPTAYPVADLTTSQAVTGRTVTQGTTPGSFTGSVQGVVQDGIAPGVDLILADLASPTINRVGIWAGMSGSPVYASDGRLIGAVSYGLSFGPSTIAGITPAADMLKLSGAQPVARAHKVALPRSLAKRVAGHSKVSAKQASQGLSELPLSVGLSGPSSAQMKKLARGFSINGTQARAAAAAPVSTQEIPVVTGGNLVGSLSYGTITFAGTGTATAVCGDDVVGFGHPMLDSGPSTLSMHGASTVLIQDDPTFSGFTVSNPGAPIGSIKQDRLVGITGSTGAVPASSRIASTASVGGASTSGTTHVTQQDYMPDITLAHLYTVQGKALDRTGAGGAYGTYTIKGTRKNGTPFSMTRRNRWADPYDISYAAAEAAAEDVYAIQNNPGEVVKITSVTADTHLSKSYATYVIARVEVRSGGRWVTAQRDEPVAVHAGTKAQLRVTLRSREAATRTVRMQVRVPRNTAKRLGTLKVVGGNSSYEDSEEFFDDEEGDFFDEVPVPRPSTLPALLAQLSGGQRNNEIRATVRFRKAPGKYGTPRTGSKTVSDVVSGYDVFPVVAVK